MRYLINLIYGKRGKPHKIVSDKEFGDIQDKLKINDYVLFTIGDEHYKPNLKEVIDLSAINAKITNPDNLTWGDLKIWNK